MSSDCRDPFEDAERGRSRLAQRVIDADARFGGAAVAVDGKMADRPLVLRAATILGEALARQ